MEDKFRAFLELGRGVRVMKKRVFLMTAMIMMAMLMAFASNSAEVSVNLKIGAIQEILVNDEAIVQDGEGFKIDFQPAEDGVQGYREDFSLSLITNSKFIIDYYWENEDALGDGVSAMLELGEKDIKDHLIDQSGSFEAYAQSHLMIGKNGLKATRITSDELAVERGKIDLNFNIDYDPDQAIEDTTANAKRTLRIVITFPPSV